MSWFLLLGFNVWIICQALIMVRSFKSYTCLLQTAQGVLTFLLSLIWVY